MEDQGMLGCWVERNSLGWCPELTCDIKSCIIKSCSTFHGNVELDIGNAVGRVFSQDTTSCGGWERRQDFNVGGCALCLNVAINSSGGDRLLGVAAIAKVVGNELRSRYASRERGTKEEANRDARTGAGWAVASWGGVASLP